MTRHSRDFLDAIERIPADPTERRRQLIRIVKELENRHLEELEERENRRRFVRLSARYKEFLRSTCRTNRCTSADMSSSDRQLATARRGHGKA